MKKEALLKAAFTRELSKQLPAFLVLHYASAGAPDREIVGNGVTTRWEFKHATPELKSSGIQELMCRRLDTQSHCRYVVWWERKDGTGKRTLIMTPMHVHERRSDSFGFYAEASTDGFDHRWLVERIREAHGL